MPELPEIETLKHQILKNFNNRRVEKVEVADARASQKPENLKNLEGNRLIDTSRRGKTLVLHFENDLQALIHLMISGRVFEAQGTEAPRGCMVKVIFEGGQAVCFTYLHLGFIEVMRGNEADMKLLPYGPEALDISLAELKKRLAASKKNIKAFLLDQKSIAGVGNIYVDEILYAARVSPYKKTFDLTEKQAGALHANMRNILFLGIKHRGTTIVSWEDLHGEKGGFQNYLEVVGKSDSTCKRDGQNIVKTKVAGRTTYYCPGCQK